jgi:4-amino-4-deoxy-L-arabinose transferase-like glycosyltransferase
MILTYHPSNHLSRYGLLFVIVLALTLYRVWALHTLGLDPYVDEVYYWGWAQTPDWGYYSKPPLLAWLIGASLFVFGDTVWALKLPSLLLYPLTAFVIAALGTRLFNRRVGFWSALVFLTLPLTGILTLFVSTDAPLLFFWSLGMWFAHRAITQDRPSDWAMVGVLFGLGMLSKYTMAAFAGCLFLVLAGLPGREKALRKKAPWWAFLLGLLIFLPNIIWNVNHDFPTFTHTAEITRLHERAWNFSEFLNFLGAQWLSLGPFFGLIVLAVFIRPSRFWYEHAGRFLLLFCLPLLFLVGLQALTGRANGNWAAPALLSCTLLGTAFCLQFGRRIWLSWAIALNVVMMPIAYHWPVWLELAKVDVRRNLDPFKRARGWTELAAQIEPHLRAHPNATLVAPDRELLAHLVYALRPKQYASWNPQGRMMDHYQLKNPLTSENGAQVLFISRTPDVSELMPYFSSPPRLLEPVSVLIHSDFSRAVFVFLLEGFSGYAPLAAKEEIPLDPMPLSQD